MTGGKATDDLENQNPTERGLVAGAQQVTEQGAGEPVLISGLDANAKPLPDTKKDGDAAPSDREDNVKIVPVLQSDMAAIKKAAGEGNFESDPNSGNPSNDHNSQASGEQL